MQEKRRLLLQVKLWMDMYDFPAMHCMFSESAGIYRNFPEPIFFGLN